MDDQKSHIIRVIDSCRVCGFKKLIPILSLGDLYVSDFLKKDASECPSAPLELVLCNERDGGCGLLQLKHTVSPKVMYRNYWYRSGLNKTMTDELGDIARKVEAVAQLKSDDFVIDIGSNDSTLLRSYNDKGLNRIGFEPAVNIVEKYGREGVTDIIPDFFNFAAWNNKYGDKKAKAITAIAMFYDLDDPNAFVADLVKCLDKDGCLVIQMLYLPSLLERNAFDGICHEHLEYYSLSSFENLLNRHNLEIFDAEYRPINEGSYRFFIRHKGEGKLLNIDSGASSRVKRLRDKEKELGLDDKKIYEDFVKRVYDIKEKTVAFVKNEVAKGKKIHAYGASTKGNTLLQFFGLRYPTILAAAERNPDKWGLQTVGTSIPIISEDASRAEADYFLVLPWHFLKEFRERESDFLKKGGKLIVPLPEFTIVSHNSPTKFTLITACKNEEKDVHLAIESALAQTYPNKEIIFVDDSSDGTKDIIRKYADRGVILVNGEGHGCCEARNLGTRRATGDVIVFLTADTKLEPDYLWRILGYYEQGYDWVTTEDKVYNLDSAYSRFVEMDRRPIVYRDDFQPTTTQGYSVRRQAAFDVGLITSGIYPVNFCRDWSLGKKLTEKGYKKIYDRSINVPHKAPDNFSEYWQVRRTRGLMSAYQPYFMFHKSPLFLFLKFVAKNIIALLHFGLIVPALWHIAKVARYSNRPIRDFFPFYYAYFIQVLARCVGEWQGWWFIVRHNHMNNFMPQVKPAN